MNGKRQTIWLVSMLSLMVVLSAYYLFTEDSGVSAPTETAGSIQVEGNVKDAAGSTLPSVGDEGVVINEVVKDGDVVVDPGTAADTGAVATDADTNSSKDGLATDTAVKDPLASEQAAATSETTKDPVKDTAVKEKDTSASADQPVVKDDAAILDEVASQSVSASSMFTNYLYEREQKNLKDYNDLLALVNDMDKTPADNAMAQEQLRSLEEKESKITGIEEKLQLKFGEAIVKEEKGNTYKVVVLSDKLDVKQAVGIIDLVMKELSVTQDKISVQYVSE
ncbi:SpoIIIAH-like family protein [Paenibacillus wynnii]|uniref:SpoIIIAH-like family protein n=1 Tax=Paenibacillus wynnii TaxID=268407 RepID=UPI002793E267|nr:SpoIIIAH-like family protein [Paenibacillus wynnii]MDQ0194413.1 stage III sporulation protein AH [Paenibacillus wynnii]